jgi:ornithine carbamoyltransferase
MRSAKERSDFMLGRTAVLIFASLSLGERLCVTAAVRQMAGYIVYESPHDSWREELGRYQRQILPVFDYFVDCLYSYGLPLSAWDMEKAAPNFPVINVGSPDAHPAHALADIACMLRGSGDLKGVVAAWIGCDNGTLHSLIEATAFFPFALRVSLPPHVDAGPLKNAANRLQTPVSFVDTPENAVKGADYIFAGCSGEMDTEAMQVWRLDADIMRLAADGARVLLSASPVHAITVEQSVFASTASLLTRQADYRLRVHKRILHWVFLENERAL